VAQVTEPIRLSEHLYLLRDTCNAYLIRKGSRALVIDCGDAGFTSRLRGLGVEAVEWLLFTHHHRDQSQGAEKLVGKGARVAVPEHERFLFEHASEYMQHRPVYDSYNGRSTVQTRLTDLPVHQPLQDYETFRWRGFELRVIPTPGHTRGACSLLCEIDGKRVAFTGDLLCDEGRFPSLHDLEHNYGGCEGADQTAYSAIRLQREPIDLICPSHGEPISNAHPALRALQDNARAWYRWRTGSELPCVQRPIQVTEHLFAFPQACCAWYALVAENGQALFIDHGTADGPHFGMHEPYREPWETARYVDHGLWELQNRHGLRSVAVAIPTHYHDDHVAGFPYLRKRFGAEVWASEELQDILEHPERYSELCLLPTPIPVARKLADGEEFEWNGFRLQAWHFPGQTEYHSLILLHVDGKRVLFTGDSLQRIGNHLACPVIMRNNLRFGSHEECAHRLMGLRADIIAPGHGEPWAPHADEFASLRQHTQQLRTLFRRVLPENAGLDAINPYWVRIRPYQIEARRGGKAKLTVEITNPRHEPVSARVTMAGPSQIAFEPALREITLGPGQVGAAKFELSVSQRYKGLPRVAVAADISLGDERMGQATEAFVDIAG